MEFALTKERVLGGIANASLGLLLACGPQPGPAETTSNKSIITVESPKPIVELPVDTISASVRVASRFKSGLGKWSGEEVETLAQGMMAESKYPQIAEAGKVLSDSQGNLPALSTISPLFSDTPLSIMTVPNLFSVESGDGVEIPLRGDLSTSENVLDFDLSFKDGAPSRSFRLSDSLYLRHILINANARENGSDFWLMLQMAKEIQRAKAVDIVSSELAKDFYKDYEVPLNESEQRAVRIQLVQSQMPLESMPSFYAVWSLSHFLLIPDYLKAKDDARFAGITYEDGLGFFKIAARAFQRSGALARNEFGDYVWTSNGSARIKNWLAFSVALKPSTPKIPRVILN